MTNDHADWDNFDSAWYCDHNYLDLRDDDRKILIKVRDFLAQCELGSDAQGVDVGPGANLYPSLAMLPYCARIDLLEYSGSNVAWLQDQVGKYDQRWDAFWQVLLENPTYRRITDPRARLAEVAVVRKASVFDLPRAQWDIGMMFFVACSLSTEIAEYRRAVACFVHSLKPGAPFAAAFMEKSEGYPVDGVWFPAVAIDQKVVTDSLESLAYDVEVERIVTGNPLRDGYGGAMLIAVGRASGKG